MGTMRADKQDGRAALRVCVRVSFGLDETRPKRRMRPDQRQQVLLAPAKGAAPPIRCLASATLRRSLIRNAHTATIHLDPPCAVATIRTPDAGLIAPVWPLCVAQRSLDGPSSSREPAPFATLYGRTWTRCPKSPSCQMNYAPSINKQIASGAGASNWCLKLVSHLRAASRRNVLITRSRDHTNTNCPGLDRRWPSRRSLDVHCLKSRARLSERPLRTVNSLRTDRNRS